MDQDAIARGDGDPLPGQRLVQQAQRKALARGVIDRHAVRGSVARDVDHEPASDDRLLGPPLHTELGRPGADLVVGHSLVETEPVMPAAPEAIHARAGLEPEVVEVVVALIGVRRGHRLFGGRSPHHGRIEHVERIVQVDHRALADEPGGRPHLFGSGEVRHSPFRRPFEQPPARARRGVVTRPQLPICRKR